MQVLSRHKYHLNNMKKALLTLAVALAGSTAALAYPTVTVKDSISTNTHWTNDQQYLLQGYVYVTNGAVLTIDSGCIIKGDKNTKGSLIVERGAKLIAIGSATAPIVFTSNQAPGNRTYGDWGGVILCGKSPVNWNGNQSQVEGGPRSLYGGTDPHDNSGTMRYVRIEFPGIAFSPNNEINGLTFCGVGDATQIDHIQVSFSGDDSYEWFGGNVNTKNIIAFRGWDDDFDTDNGYSGKNQFCVGLRDPFIADQSGSKGFESDSYQSGTATGLAGDTSMITKPVFSNVTLAGPLVSPTSTAYDPQFVAAIHIRRGSAISILNSIIFGYPAGVLVDESSASFGSTSANIANGILQFRNNIVAGIAATSTNAPNGSKDVVYVKDGARSLTATNTNADTLTNTPFAPNAGPFSWLKSANNTYATEQNGVRLQNPFNLTNPDFRPTSTSPVSYNTKGNGSATAGSFNTANPINTDTSNGYANYNVPQVAPNFTTNKASDPFFTKTNYVGAFSGNLVTQENWFANWTNFDPVNTNYSNCASTIFPCPGLGINSYSGPAKNIQNAKVIPNPAAGNAALMIELNAISNVTITILDITGRNVATVFTGKLPAGIQSVPVNLSNLNAGMYLMNVATENGTKIVRFTVAK